MQIDRSYLNDLLEDMLYMASLIEDLGYEDEVSDATRIGEDIQKLRRMIDKDMFKEVTDGTR